jgi:hypothetical protein
VRWYHGFFVVELFSFLFDVIDVFLDLQLLLSTLESIREEKFAVESSDLLCILEELAVGEGQFFLFLFQLESFLLLIYFSTLELLLLEFSIAFLLFSFFEVLGVVNPLVGSLLALLILMNGKVLISV